MESLLYVSFFKTIKPRKIKQTVVRTMHCSVVENGVIQDSGNFMKMKIMTCCA